MHLKTSGKVPVATSGYQEDHTSLSNVLLPSRDGPQQPHPPELALETSLSNNVHRVNSHAQDNHPSHKNSNEPTKRVRGQSSQQVHPLIRGES